MPHTLYLHLNCNDRTLLFRCTFTASPPHFNLNVKDLASVEVGIGLTERGKTIVEPSSALPLGGVRAVLEETRRHLDCVLHPPAQRLRRHFHSGPVGPMLISGAAGAGKSGICAELLRHYAGCSPPVAGIQLTCVDVAGLPAQMLVDRIRTLFREGVAMAPAVVVLDDLHRLFGADVNRSLRVVHALRAASNAVAEQRVAVVATATGSGDWEQIFPTRVTVSSPDANQRAEMATALMQRWPSLDWGVTAEWLGMRTVGFVPADIRQLLERSVHVSSIRGLDDRTLVEEQDVVKAEEGFVPLSLKGVKLESSQVEWKDIGGLENVKAVLKETLEWPTKYPDIFAGVPLRLRSG